MFDSQVTGGSQAIDEASIDGFEVGVTEGKYEGASVGIAHKHKIKDIMEINDLPPEPVFDRKSYLDVGL